MFKIQFEWKMFGKILLVGGVNICFHFNFKRKTIDGNIVWCMVPHGANQTGNRIIFAPLNNKQ